MAPERLGPDCPLCQLDATSAGRRITLGFGDVVVAYVDDELLGLVPTESDGVFVVPRAHADSLFDDAEVTGLRPAAVLAALRRVGEVLKPLWGVDEVTIEPTPGSWTNQAAVRGHIGFHIRPVGPRGGSEPSSEAIEAAVRLGFGSRDARFRISG